MPGIITYTLPPTIQKHPPDSPNTSFRETSYTFDFRLYATWTVIPLSSSLFIISLKGSSLTTTPTAMSCEYSILQISTRVASKIRVGKRGDTQELKRVTHGKQQQRELGSDLATYIANKHEPFQRRADLLHYFKKKLTRLGLRRVEQNQRWSSRHRFKQRGVSYLRF